MPCLFVNYRPECDKWGKVLNFFPVIILLLIDVLQINGNMDKNGRYVFMIHLFTPAVSMLNFNSRVLMETAADDTGIDQRQLKAVFHVSFPCYILTH